MRLDRRDTLKFLGAGAGISAAASSLPVKADASAVEFHHGVASGDPLKDRLILWTRVTPTADPAGDAPVSVSWKVAEDADFARVVARGRTSTGPQRDYTVKVDADGLKPGREYWYAFEVGSVRSPLGRAKTLPTGHVDELVMAFVTCALYPNGYFNAYDHIAKSDKLDAVVELGDYIYEYGSKPDDYGMANGEKLGRLPEPPHDLVSLADYRTRYAQYRRDADLQAAHARAPWICVWDDHEVCNDTWKGGAEKPPREDRGRLPGPQGQRHARLLRMDADPRARARDGARGHLPQLRLRRPGQPDHAGEPPARPLLPAGVRARRRHPLRPLRRHHTRPAPPGHRSSDNRGGEGAHARRRRAAGPLRARPGMSRR